MLYMSLLYMSVLYMSVLCISVFGMRRDRCVGGRRRQVLFWFGQTFFATARRAEAIALTGMIDLQRAVTCIPHTGSLSGSRCGDAIDA